MPPGSGGDGSRGRPSLVPMAAGTLFLLVLFYLSAAREGSRSAPLTLVGVAMLIAAVPFMVLPFAHLKAHGDPDPGDPYYAARLVVTQGVYGLVRHPQYLGYSLLALGFAALTPGWDAAVAGILAAGGFWGQTVLEERELRSRFGIEYEEYQGRVPRMNPVAGLLRWVLRRRGGKG
jgi:protein-S-isoprenylcysteine O-methyltransferase Ste14